MFQVDPSGSRQWACLFSGGVSLYHGMCEEEAWGPGGIRHTLAGMLGAGALAAVGGGSSARLDTRARACAEAWANAGGRLGGTTVGGGAEVGASPLVGAGASALAPAAQAASSED